MDRRIVLTGLSHKTAPIEVRERLALDDQKPRELLHELCVDGVIEEAVLLNTCNRVEIVAAGEDIDLVNEKLTDFVAARLGTQASRASRCFYQHSDRDAVRHLFRVASSLDSLVLGEPQIVGQVKAAYAASRDCGRTGALLNRTFHHAFYAAKRVRNETRVAENAVSVSYAAVELARKVFGRLDDKRVLVIGAGEMGALTARHLLQSGAASIDIANRSPERARALAMDVGGVGHSLEDLPALLEAADIVIASTGSQHYIVNRKMLKPVLSRRKFRRMLLVDIAVPRDIDPRCDSLSNVYVFDVDDLEKVVEANVRARRQEAQLAERIIEEEVENLERWISTTEAVPTIVQLRSKLNRLKEAELDRMVRGNGNLTPDAVELAERLANSLINKILHEPTISLREATREDPRPIIEAAKTLFKLAEDRVDTLPTSAKPDTTSRSSESEPAPAHLQSSRPSGYATVCSRLSPALRSRSSK